MKLANIRIGAGETDPQLAALLYTPQIEPKPIGVVLAHGFTSAKHSMDSMAAYLAERGYTCVTFDAVGHKLGGTGGEMRHISQSAENLRQIVGWMRTNQNAAGIVIAGHSMGAAAAIQAAAWDYATPPVSMPLLGIACLCMGLNPTAGFRTPLGASMLKMRSDYVSGAPAKELLAGLDGMLTAADNVGPIPVLLVAARNDVLLPVRNVELLAEKIGASAVIHTIEAMHLDAPEKSRGALYNWLERLTG